MPAGINCGMDCDELSDDSTTVTLTAIPDADSQFLCWSANAGCEDATFSMVSDLSCMAHFDLFP